MSSHDAAASSSSRQRRSRSRSKERDEQQRRGSKASRSRSRSRDRGRERDRERERERERKHKQRSRSRSRERDRDRERERERKDSKQDKEKDRKKDKKSEKDATRELERALKKAQKALKHGDASAMAALDPALLDQLLAEQKAKAAAASAKDGSGSSKHGKKSKRRESSSSDDSSSDSDGDDGAAAAAEEAEQRRRSPFLRDGTTPRLFPSDYFARSTEFRVWLAESKNEHVDDISSKQSRRRFGQFVDAWNSGKLAPKFYAGMDATAVGAAGLTKHKWGIKLSAAEKLALESTRDAIDTSTHHHTYAQEFKGQRGEDHEGRARIAQAQQPTAARPAAAAAASGAPPARETAEEREARHWREKAASKRAAADAAVVMEELVPRATGREAQLEKRAAKGAYARAGADKDTDMSFSDRDLLGSGGSSEFAAALARQKAAQAARANEGATKLSEHQQREKEKMQKLLQSIGMADKYPIG